MSESRSQAMERALRELLVAISNSDYGDEVFAAYKVGYAALALPPDPPCQRCAELDAAVKKLHEDFDPRKTVICTGRDKP